MAAGVGRECWPLRVAGWIVADPVSVAWDELLAGVEGECSPVVEECVEFSGRVELSGVEPGVESGDCDPGEAAGSAGSAGSDAGVAGESCLGEESFVVEHGSQPLAGHVIVLLASVDVSVDISVDVWTCGHLSTPEYLRV